MKLFLLLAAGLFAEMLYAQTYPDPEFSNEVYYLKKDNSYSLMRLEKNVSKQGTKTKLGGYGGVEYGYTIEGGKSPVRFSNGDNLSFIFSIGSSGSSNSNADSMMKASGIDPNNASGFGSDPSSTISLYKLAVDKDKRKIYLMKSGGAFSFGKKGNQSSDKYTFSLKKIRDGYWVLVVDKQLPKGEYAFSMTGGVGSVDMSGSSTVFAFGID